MGLISLLNLERLDFSLYHGITEGAIFELEALPRP